MSENDERPNDVTEERPNESVQDSGATDEGEVPAQARLSAPPHSANVDYVPTMTDPNRTWGDQSDANEGDDTEEKTAADKSNAVTEADEENFRVMREHAEEGKL